MESQKLGAMIIKSLSRKDRGFQQIIEYLHQEGRGIAEDWTYVHNMNAAPDNPTAMIEAFMENDQYRKKRKNGIVFYHEILSFAPEDTMAILENPDMLRDITAQYLQDRAPYALAVARPHIDKDHVHIHLVISACEQGRNKTIRISKVQMEKVKQSIRAYQQQYYPELVHSYQVGQKRQVEQLKTHITQQMEKRGQRQNQKEQLKKQLLHSLRQASSWTVLQKDLAGKNIGIYHRQDKITGLIWQGRKFRFQTLIQREREDLQKILSQNLEKKQEAELMQAWSREGKLFGIPKLPDASQWERIRQDLERLEEEQTQFQRYYQQQRDKGLERGL